MKRIAIIIPKLTGGGAEKVAANLSLNLSKIYEKYLIIYDKSKVTYDYSGELLCINNKRNNNFFGKIYSLLTRIILVKKIKKKYNIETSVSFMENPNFVNVLSNTGDKVIISIRIYKSKSPNDLYGIINKIFMRVLYNRADYIVAVSELIKEDLVQNFGIKCDKIKVIYNSYDIKRINELGLQKIEDDLEDFFKGNVITNMGRLEPQKGQAHLIKAFVKVKQVIPDAKLLIIGQGSLERELKELTQILRVADEVKFIGYTDNPFKYLKKSKLFVLSSLFEGFPNALCEAMACGIPVISTDCKSGPREILCTDADYSRKADGIEYMDYGVLVPAFKENSSLGGIELTNEEEILETAINKMLLDKKLWNEYSSKAFKRIKDFSVESIIEKWQEIL